jgi:hypothetical protein
MGMDTLLRSVRGATTTTILTLARLMDTMDRAGSSAASLSVLAPGITATGDAVATTVAAATTVAVGTTAALDITAAIAAELDTPEVEAALTAGRPGMPVAATHSWAAAPVATTAAAQAAATMAEALAAVVAAAASTAAVAVDTAVAVAVDTGNSLTLVQRNGWRNRQPFSFLRG